MNHSPKMLHALELADEVHFIARSVAVCDRGHVGCWRVTMVASADLGKQAMRVYEGPFLHMELTQALDVVATVAAHHGSALELIESARSDAGRQLSLLATQDGATVE